jgi:hypothetical protein
MSYTAIIINTCLSHKRSTQIHKILYENMHDHNVEKYDFTDAIQRSPMDRPPPHHLPAYTQRSPTYFAVFSPVI